VEEVGLKVAGGATIDARFWQGKRVLLTGHTGFKGSWLSLWLQSLGATLGGLALDPPTEPSLFEAAHVTDGMTSVIGDIRDLATVQRAIGDFAPDIVLHMAAQPLVRYSYVEPVDTYATNVMGTVHVLEAARATPSVKVVLNVTSDKCYENQERDAGYREDEPMGGYDPYSNSKGCAELVTSAYRRSFMTQAGIALGSARAGNVIGGGDWASDRLVPDILRAFDAGRPVVIRNPTSIRPWQHVLEPLSGYLVLAQRLWSDSTEVSEGWNFGPHDQDARPVQWIVEQVVERWGEGASWQTDDTPHPHEAHYLKLDITKARIRLGWEPQWSLGEALERIVEWQQAYAAGSDLREVCLQQITDYTKTMGSE
jgi:CDP-glucose 4,6-dehydratase